MTDTTLAMSLPVFGLDPRDDLALAQQGRAWGYDALWGAEVDGPDAFSLLGAVAATTDLDLGVAVVPVQTRTAFVLAMSAITLQNLTGGRFALGIGASSEVLVQRFGGVPFERPLRHLKEMAQALRPALAGERTTLDGEVVRIGGYRSPIAPVAPVPLYLGSLNPRSLRLAGELADGICLNQMTVDHVPTMLAEVAAGATAAGRDATGLPVVARLFCAVTDDAAPVRAMLPHVFAPYVATAGYARFYTWMGFGDQVKAIAEATAARDKAAAAAAYTPEMVERIFLVGSAGQVVDRIEEFTAAGVTLPAVMPIAVDVAGAASTLEAIGAEWRRRHGT